MYSREGVGVATWRVGPVDKSLATNMLDTRHGEADGVVNEQTTLFDPSDPRQLATNAYHEWRGHL